MKFTKFDAGGWPGVQLDLDLASAGPAEAPSLSPGTPESPGAVTAPSAEQPEETAAKEIAEEIYKEEEVAEPGWKEIEDRLAEKKRRLAEVENEIAGKKKEVEFLIRRPYSHRDPKFSERGMLFDVVFPEISDLPCRCLYSILKQIRDFPEVTEFISRAAEAYRDELMEKYRKIREEAEMIRKERSLEK